MKRTTKPQQRLKYPSDWQKCKQNKKKITILTAYDASSALLLTHTPLDAILIGDSLGMTVQGHKSTLFTTLDEMIYHCRMVRRGAPELFLIGDMPFGSWQTSSKDAISNAIRLVKEGKVDAVKFEGAHPELLDAIQRLISHGIPVMGHVGLTPQSFQKSARFQVQGRDKESQKKISEDSQNLQNAGCFALVLELLSSSLAKEITETLTIPTIGIGSGRNTSGQVLVLHDMLGWNTSSSPRHAKRYTELGQTIIAAVNQYVSEVSSGTFPNEEHS